MAFTQSDIDALKAAIASPIKRIEFNNRMKEKRSIGELRTALAIAEAEVNASTRTKVVKAYMGEDL